MQIVWLLSTVKQGDNVHYVLGTIHLSVCLSAHLPVRLHSCSVANSNKTHGIA